jgi:hypothetical protein
VHRDVRDQLESEGARQNGYEEQVQAAAKARGNQANDGLEQREHKRRQQHESEGEQQDVAAGIAAGDEELRGVAQQAEQRLRERERPQHPEVKSGEPKLSQAAAMSAHVGSWTSLQPGCQRSVKVGRRPDYCGSAASGAQGGLAGPTRPWCSSTFPTRAGPAAGSCSHEP